MPDVRTNESGPVVRQIGFATGELSVCAARSAVCKENITNLSRGSTQYAGHRNVAVHCFRNLPDLF